MQTLLNNWTAGSSSFKQQVTRTFYDAALDFGPNSPINQENLRNRVSYSSAGLFGGKTLLYNYKYDQLNRITGLDAYNGFNLTNNNWNGMVKLDQYQERVAYDGNGNIQKYLRHGHLSGGNLVMDSLTYKYETASGRHNRLLRVVDNVPVSRYGTYRDLDNMGTPITYRYDSIGNLAVDVSEGNTTIKWTVYGKIQEIIRNATPENNVIKIVYTYDASGNRISSVTTRSGTSNLEYVWYVRDAQGNAIAVYKATGTSTLTTLSPVLSERMIYGSSRLGSNNDVVSVEGGAQSMSNIFSFGTRRGFRNYELSNHLGNVLATISDKKIGVPSAGNSSLIDYYVPDITNATSYYPFGSIMPGRSWSGGGKYRYGFNGKENDNNVKNAEGTQQDYGMRIYDPRVGRFLSVDPLTIKYPELTPYQFASNRPIDGIDMDGLEYMKSIPTFDVSNDRTWLDYLSGAENGVINMLNVVPSTWNSAIATYESIRRGTYKNDLTKDAKQFYNGLKSKASEVVDQPLKTLTSPEALEFAVSAYLGSKVLPSGNKGNLLVPTRSTVEFKFSATLPPGTQTGGFSLGGAVSKYYKQFGRCVEFADEFKNRFARSIEGSGGSLKTFEINIGKNGLIGTSEYQLSNNGMHRFVEVTIGKDTKIFDNFHPDGVFKNEYFKKIAGATADGKLLEGDLLLQATKEVK